MNKPKKLSKLEIEQKIKDVFSKTPTSEQIKKIKKLAMSKNIKLKEYKKLFCKKCYSLFNSNNSEIRIKKPYKIIKCKNCGYVNRWKMS
jgi:RNase P subunit RPR2